VLPFVHPLAEALWQHDPDPKSAITTFHLVFNLAIAVACLGLGIRFGVGSLAHLLKNRFYIGEVVYRGEMHIHHKKSSDPPGGQKPHETGRRSVPNAVGIILHLG
jgi:hypothetical protein